MTSRLGRIQTLIPFLEVQTTLTLRAGLGLSSGRAEMFVSKAMVGGSVEAWGTNLCVWRRVNSKQASGYHHLAPLSCHAYPAAVAVVFGPHHRSDSIAVTTTHQ